MDLLSEQSIEDLFFLAPLPGSGARIGGGAAPSVELDSRAALGRALEVALGALVSRSALTR